MPGPNLSELLLAKETRAQRQQELCQQYQQTLVSVTLNIPGPHKNPPTSQALLAWAVTQLTLQFPLTYHQELTCATGNEHFFITTAPALEVKLYTQHLEELYPFCRLLDLDVFSANFTRLSCRKQGRNCFFCARPASLCIREATHSQLELQTYSLRLLEDFRKFSKEQPFETNLPD